MKLNKNLALSESGFAFNGSTGDTFLLNETALFIIQKIKEQLPTDKILQSIIDSYDVPPIIAEKDFIEFINQLKSYQLIEE